jgi:DNA (cytosine-5)-methyltransferase 1
LNAKKHGVPQNRERVFLIGIRDDQDNTFTWPAEEELTKRLKDVLEDSVDDKYFLSNERIDYLVRHQVNKNILIDDIPNESKTCIASYYKQPRDCQYLKVTNFQGSEISNTIRTGGKGTMSNKHNWDTIKIGTWRTHKDGQGFREIEDGNCPTIPARAREDGSGQPVIQVTQCNQGVMIGAFRGRNPNNPSDRTTGIPTEQRLEININGTSNTLTSVQKDNVVIENYKIRRLTPRECFRLMDFPDTFTWPVSDSQAYKQAGNSIVVRVLEKIINNLPL